MTTDEERERERERERIKSQKIKTERARETGTVEKREMREGKERWGR